jgi:hypothetical protein
MCDSCWRLGESERSKKAEEMTQFLNYLDMFARWRAFLSEEYFLSKILSWKVDGSMLAITIKPFGSATFYFPSEERAQLAEKELQNVKKQL